MPASLPVFTKDLDEALEQACQETAFGPLWSFTTRWSIHVQIERHPRVAARFRELEDLVVELDDREQIREAISELGRILDDAHEAIGYGRR